MVLLTLVLLLRRTTDTPVHLLGLSDFADASSSVNYADLVDASSFVGTVALQTLVHLSDIAYC